MKLRPPEKRQTEENVIPLINVVFLLLIFFVLVGSLTPPEALDVTPPTSASRDPAGERETVVFLAADGRLAIGSQEVGQDRLQQLIAAQLAKDKLTLVQLKADARVEADRLLTVMDLLREAGVKALILLTRPEES